MSRFRLLLPLVLLLVVARPASAQEPNFGRAIALNGNDLVIGQPVNWYGPGTVYTYRPGSGGAWMEAQRLTAPDSSRMDDFGGALALDGNRLAVAAPRKRDGEGVVYLFERSGDGAEWAWSATIDESGSGDRGQFGAALALAGDELLVGSPSTDGTGRVLRYTLQGGTWTAAGALAPGDEGAAGFGMALALDGDRLVIGAPNSDERMGRAYVAMRTGGDWSAPAAVERPDGLEGRVGFGSAALWSGDHLVVGAPGSGMAMVYEMDAAGSWAAAHLVRPFDLGDGSRFGSSFARSDDALWVGAPNAAGRDGRVYRVALDADGSPRGVERVDPDDLSGGSWPLGFGYAIGADGDRVVVGMPSRDFGEGRAMALSASDANAPDRQLLQGEVFRLGGAITTGERCEDGRMAGEFPCEGVEMVGHLQTTELGGERGAWVNDVWGWEDTETGRRYALVARRDGASFVDLTDLSAPRVVGNLPRTEGSRPSTWRDIKTIGTWAFIVSDGAGQHGMQVFDLTRLRDVGAEMETFDPDVTYTEMASAHNVVADGESGYVYIVGANSGGTTCGGGLHIVDVRDPLHPTFAGCYRDEGSASSSGYTHDAQCLVYRGPDADYQGRQICLGSNESELNIADVTDKANPVTVSRASYPNVAYAHQGWLDGEQRFFYMNDEGDETAGVVERTRTMVWDLTDLDDPILVNQYFGPVPASDHNLYVNGDRMYQSNYGSGLRVLDISDRANPREIAHFDSAPYNDDGPGFSSSESGAWSNYPFFEDGLVIFTSVREGLFIMRVRGPIT